MANLHILTRDGNRYTIALHVAVPAGNNGAAVPWNTAVLGAGLAPPSTLRDGDGTAGTIGAVEKSAIAAGSLVEVLDSVETPAALAGAALLTWLDQYFAARSAEVLAGLQTRLGQWGRVR